MTEIHDCSGDAAAYVLGALEPAEADAFQTHLQQCVVCRDEVALLEQVADALPMAAPQYAAPAQLRRRVMDAVAAEPRAQAAPASARPSRTRPSRTRRSRSPFPRLLPRPALALGLAVVAAVAVLVGVEAGGSGPSSPGAARIIQADLGSAAIRLQGASGELIVRHLPPPPAGHIYEVWLKRPHALPEPTQTLFSVTSGGTSLVGLPGSMRGVVEVMVTPEPSGGSPVPTHAPVIDVHI